MKFKCIQSQSNEPYCLRHGYIIELNGKEYPISTCIVEDRSIFCDICERQHHIIKDFRASEQGKKESEIFHLYALSFHDDKIKAKLIQK